jgi:DNA repair protein RadA/Sms
MGKCPQCGEWNTLEEELISSGKKNPRLIPRAEFMPLAEVPASKEDRLTLKDEELNRVLGGGLVAGSAVLMAGEPGIGKSTLLLQFILNQPELKALYVSGEESASQIKMRADRIGGIHPNVLISTSTDTDEILALAGEVRPDLVIVDSIQTLASPLIESPAGSVSQIRQCAAEVIRFAKVNLIPVVMIGHITKDGSIAGPKVLEHMVDTVLHFEGDRNHYYRLLRAVKNRFGAANELGIYEMHGAGLREVKNPSEFLSGGLSEGLSGSATGVMVEGLRPLLIEVQALVSSAVYGTPQRSATGFDVRRLNMLLAVLEKRCGFRIGVKDVFLNMAGGIRCDDPTVDLAVAVAILSGNEDIAVPAKNVFAGEIGLSGEIRPSARMEQRIREAEKLGMETIFISSHNRDIQSSKFTIKVEMCGRVEEVFEKLFG